MFNFRKYDYQNAIQMKNKTVQFWTRFHNISPPPTSDLLWYTSVICGRLKITLLSSILSINPPISPWAKWNVEIYSAWKVGNVKKTQEIVSYIHLKLTIFVLKLRLNSLKSFQYNFKQLCITKINWLKHILSHFCSISS